MPALICDSKEVEALIRHRQECGGDRYDEVWDGLYIMSPSATLEHQRLIGELSAILCEVLDRTGEGTAYAGANVTDRQDDWTQNYRCPDVVVVLDESADRCRDIESALLGGPDFLIEVRSPHDKTFDKLDFYGSIGVRELLVIDRDDKSLRLFRLTDGRLIEVSAVEGGLTCQTVGLSFRTLPERKVEIKTIHGPMQSWTI